MHLQHCNKYYMKECKLTICHTSFKNQWYGWICSGISVRCSRFGTVKYICIKKWGGIWGGKRGRKKRDCSYGLLAFTVLYNSRGDRRRATGTTGGSGAWGWGVKEECPFLNLIRYLQGRYRCPRSGLSVPGRYK